MIMTESILSIIFSELNLRPISDEDDIKHFNIKHRKINKNLVKFKSHKDHQYKWLRCCKTLLWRSKKSNSRICCQIKFRY